MSMRDALIPVWESMLRLIERAAAASPRRALTSQSSNVQQVPEIDFNRATPFNTNTNITHSYISTLEGTNTAIPPTTAMPAVSSRGDKW
jgi:hypothetical protein